MMNPRESLRSLEGRASQGDLDARALLAMSASLRDLIPGGSVARYRTAVADLRRALALGDTGAAESAVEAIESMMAANPQPGVTWMENPPHDETSYMTKPELVTWLEWHDRRGRVQDWTGYATRGRYEAWDVERLREEVRRRVTLDRGGVPHDWQSPHGWYSNPSDDRIRRLERAASQGDPQAIAELRRWRERTIDWDAKRREMLRWSWETAALSPGLLRDAKRLLTTYVYDDGLNDLRLGLIGPGGGEEAIYRNAAMELVRRQLQGATAGQLAAYLSEVEWMPEVGERAVYFPSNHTFPNIVGRIEWAQGPLYGHMSLPSAGGVLVSATRMDLAPTWVWFIGEPRPNPPRTLAARDYVSPRQRPLTPAEAHVRDVAYGLKSGELWAVGEAARAMSPFVPRGAALVPVPGHQPGPPGLGTRALAGALARRTGGVHAPVLVRTEGVPSSRELRQAGGRGLPPGVHAATMRQVAPLPPGEPVLVDNVVVSGATFEGARRALGRPDALAVAYARGEDVAIPVQNPSMDPRLRRLEREAAHDPEARARLLHERVRAGQVIPPDFTHEPFTSEADPWEARWERPSPRGWHVRDARMVAVHWHPEDPHLVSVASFRGDRWSWIHGGSGGRRRLSLSSGYRLYTTPDGSPTPELWADPEIQRVVREHLSEPPAKRRKRNPDPRLRRLERDAAAGDPEARARLERERERAGLELRPTQVDEPRGVGGSWTATWIDPPHGSLMALDTRIVGAQWNEYGPGVVRLRLFRGNRGWGQEEHVANLERWYGGGDGWPRTGRPPAELWLDPAVQRVVRRLLGIQNPFG